MVLARASPVRFAAGPVRVSAAVPKALSSSSGSASSAALVLARDARPRILRRPSGSSRRPLLPLSSSSTRARTRATLNEEQSLSDGKKEKSSSSSSGSSSSGEENNDGNNEEEFSPEPDAAAFANLVVLAACVTALGALTGVDPWATLFPASSDPSATSAASAVALGLAAAVPYSLSLLAARSLVCEGSIWWAEVEGQGALAGLSPPRAIAWASAVALADGAGMRGLVLPWLTKLVTNPGGVDVAEVARRAAQAPDDLLLKPAAEAAAAGLFASPADALVAAGLGSPAAPFPMPAAWLLPVVALAAGAAGAALSCFEPPAGIRAGFRAGREPVVTPQGDALLDPETGKPETTMVVGFGIDVAEKAPEGSDEASTMREILWAYWGDDDGEEEGEEGEGEEEQGRKVAEKGQEGSTSPAAAASAASPSSFAAATSSFKKDEKKDEAPSNELSYDDLAAIAEASAWLRLALLDLLRLFDRVLPWRTAVGDEEHEQLRRRALDEIAAKVVEASAPGQVGGGPPVSVERLKAKLEERRLAREEGTMTAAAATKNKPETTTTTSGAAAAEQQTSAAASELEVSLGELLSDPAGTVGKFAAAYSEEELVDLLAESAASPLRLLAAANRATGGKLLSAAVSSAADARREAVEDAIAAWKQLRGLRGEKGLDKEDALLDSPELVGKVLRRIEELEREEAEAAARKKLKARKRRPRGGDDDGEGGLRRTGLVRRWPKKDGPLRYWKVPLLVGLEGAGLAALTLATHSVLAAAVAQAAGLFALAMVERREKGGGEAAA